MAKMLVVLAAIASSTVLLSTGRIGEAAGVGIITACLGYVFGNGHGIAEAKRTLDNRVDELAKAGALERRDR